MNVLYTKYCEIVGNHGHPLRHSWYYVSVGVEWAGCFIFTSIERISFFCILFVQGKIKKSSHFVMRMYRCLTQVKTKLGSKVKCPPPNAKSETQITFFRSPPPPYQLADESSSNGHSNFIVTFIQFCWLAYIIEPLFML